MLFLSRFQSMVERAAQLRQTLRKRLPGPADLLFAPALPLADQSVHALLYGNKLLVALRHQLLGFALSAVARRLDCRSQGLSRVRQLLLNALKLARALAFCNRPKPRQQRGRK